MYPGEPCAKAVERRDRTTSHGAKGVTGPHLTHLIYTLYTETHTPASAESLYQFTLFPHTGTVLYIVSMAKARGL